MEANLSSFTKKKKSRESKGIIKKKKDLYIRMCAAYCLPPPRNANAMNVHVHIHTEEI